MVLMRPEAQTGGGRKVYCRFRHGEKTAYGIVEGDRVAELSAAPFGPHERTGAEHALADVTLLVPTTPTVFACAGRNYAGHVREMARSRGIEAVLPQTPEIGDRAVSALVAHEADIVKPADSTEQFQYEGELVAVFGREGRRIPREEALDYVFGWTIGNDVTERTWQRQDATMWRSKNSDTFKPMGPWIVTGLDPRELTTRVRVNGEVTDEFATGDMLFDVATYISEVSKYITFRPGDVLWLGTDGLPANLAAGDICEIEIDGIGVLRNRVVAEEV